MFFYSPFMGLTASGAASGLLYVGSLTQSGNGSVQRSLNLSSIGTLEENDLLIAVASEGTTSSPPIALNGSDLTYAVQNAGSDIYSIGISVGYRILSASDISADTVSTNYSLLTNKGTTLTIYVIRGADTSTPIDVTPTTASGSNTPNSNPPAITPVTDGAWVFVTAGSGLWSTTTLLHNNTPSLDNFKSVFGNSGLDVTLSTGIYTAWTSGSYDPATLTLTGSPGVATNQCSYAASCVAIRPAT